MNWVIAVGAVVLLGTAVVTLRAAEQATQPSKAPVGTAGAVLASPNAVDPATTPRAVGPAGAVKQHPPASAPEESATIADDPTTAPDPSQSADNNVSFPTDI